MMLLALTGALLLPIGCGGSGESTIALTKAQFLRQASTICLKYNAKMTRDLSAYLDTHAGKVRSEAIEDKAAATVVLPFRKKEVRRLRALGTPSGEEKYVDKMLTAWEEGIERGEEDPHSLRQAGPESAFYKSYSMGIDYGLEKCWLG
jgi:hypothetical protein